VRGAPVVPPIGKKRFGDKKKNGAKTEDRKQETRNNIVDELSTIICTTTYFATIVNKWIFNVNRTDRARVSCAIRETEYGAASFLIGHATISRVRSEPRVLADADPRS